MDPKTLAIMHFLVNLATTTVQGIDPDIAFEEQRLALLGNSPGLNKTLVSLYESTATLGPMAVLKDHPNGDFFALLSAHMRVLQSES